ncbi:MAG: hypothetical protein MJ230_00265 [bacterium]|nr:hypothetical protein [bacterium]
MGFNVKMTKFLTSFVCNSKAKNLPNYIVRDLEKINSASERTVFEGLFKKAGKMRGEGRLAVEYVDDIVQKYNMCPDSVAKQRAMEIINGKQDFYKNLRDAEDILDSVCTKEGLYFSLGNVCTKGELKLIEKELRGFYDNVFCPQIKPKRSSINCIASFDGGQGAYNPYINATIMDSNMITKPVIYKVIDKTTRKTVDSKNCLWQMHGSRKCMLSKIEKQGLKNVELVPLSRNERLNSLKSSLAHENFHACQFNNMLLHPNIGYKELNKCFELLLDQNQDIKKTQEIMTKAIWWSQSHIFTLFHKKLKPNSQLAKDTMKQFKDYREMLVLDPKSEKSLELYYKSATEVEAYSKERLFAIKNGLLI